MVESNLDLSLIPEFVPGENLTIQRNVGGRNVIMAVVVREPCSISADRLILTAGMRLWGVSAHADGRVMMQLLSIERLTKHLSAHCNDLECKHRSPLEGKL